MNTVLVGFLEEEPGVKSMARLAVAVMLVAALALALAAAYVAVSKPEHAAAVVAAIGAPLSGIAGGIWAALKERHTPASPPGGPDA